MTDLTKIEKPFGLLDVATQKALRAHFDAGGVVEYFQGWLWKPTKMIDPPAALTFRAAPLPPVTADDLAEALRVFPSQFGMTPETLRAAALLARYDAQKEAGK